MARKHYLREPFLMKRTTEIHLRTTNFSLLHFISPISIPSGLPLPPPVPIFLSKMDDLPRGIIMNKGWNKKDAAIFPPSSSSSSFFSSLYLSIHLSIQCYLWKVFHASLKTSTSFFSFHLSLLPYCCPCIFPERSAICNASCVTITWTFVTAKESSVINLVIIT